MNDPRYGALLNNQGVDRFKLPYSIVDYGGYNKVPSLGQGGGITYVDPFIGQEDVSRKPSFKNNIRDVLGGNDRSNLSPDIIAAIYKALGLDLSLGRPTLTPSNIGLQQIQQYFQRNNIPAIKTPPLDQYYGRNK